MILHPDPPLVAGVPIDLGGAEFRLVRCRECDFNFKRPAIEESKLLDCYRRADARHWELTDGGPDRQFDLIRGVVERGVPRAAGATRRVLDIGCFSGSLLQTFRHGWELHGVEPSESAAAVAAGRGVRVHGATVEALSSSPLRFDAIVNVDVAEHIVDPLAFFGSASKLLAPGGVLVTLTGDTGAWEWRFQGSLYWYCSMPEHVSFYSAASLDAIAQRLGLLPGDRRRLSHNRYSAAQRAVQMIKNVGYVAGRSIGGLGLPALRRLFVDRRAPVWMAACDHIIHVMRLPE